MHTLYMAREPNLYEISTSRILILFSRCFVRQLYTRSAHSSSRLKLRRYSRRTQATLTTEVMGFATCCDSRLIRRRFRIASVTLTKPPFADWLCNSSIRLAPPCEPGRAFFLDLGV